MRTAGTRMRLCSSPQSRGMQIMDSDHNPVWMPSISIHVQHLWPKLGPLRPANRSDVNVQRLCTDSVLTLTEILNPTGHIYRMKTRVISRRDKYLISRGRQICHPKICLTEAGHGDGRSHTSWYLHWSDRSLLCGHRRSA